MSSSAVEQYKYNNTGKFHYKILIKSLIEYKKGKKQQLLCG